MSEIRVDTISEKTSANGVAIDGVTIKDGGATLKDAGDGTGAILNLTSTDTSGASGEFLGIINFVSSDSSGGSAGTQAAIKGVYEDNGDSSGLEFFTGNSTGSGTPTLQKRMQIFHDSGVTITTADNTDTLTLTSTDADASVGPNLRLYRNSSSPADSDDIGAIRFDMRNDNSQDFTAFQITGDCSDVSDGTEDAEVHFDIMTAGTLREYMRMASGSAPHVTFNEGSQDIDFRVESNGNTNMLFVDGGNNHVNIGTSVDMGSTLNVNGSISLGNAGGTATNSLIFYDQDDTGSETTRAFISYDSSGDRMIVKARNAEIFNLDNGKIGTGGEDTADVSVGGLCLQQGGNDSNILTFKSSDVAHGITDSEETDTYFSIEKRSSDGGITMKTFHDSGDQTFRLEAFAVTENATKGTTGNAPINLQAIKKSGTGGAVFGSNANLFCVANNGVTKFIVDAEGELHSDGGAQAAYDNYEDAQLVRAFDLSHMKGVINSKFDEYVKYKHEDLADAGIVGREEDGTPNHFINVTGLQRLHNGAIWQQYEKTERLASAFYKLATKTIGKEEADKLLTEEEIQLLN